MSSDEYVPLPEIAAADVAPATYILDVREVDEWAAGHIDGSQHIPLGQLMGRLGELPADQQVVVTCKMGGRSARATAYLLQGGRDVVNLGGGVSAWSAAGRPLVDGAGAPGSVL
ncbi:MAG TPA: rhodanese-like domain-containing protein [Actinopolymorphaceae bacterium]